MNSKLRVVGMLCFFVAVVSVAIFVGVKFVQQPDKSGGSDSGVSTYKLSDADKREVKVAAANFMSNAGTFGLQVDKINSGNVGVVMDALNTAPFDSPNFYVSRGAVYQSIVGMISPYSQLYVKGANVGNRLDGSFNYSKDGYSYRLSVTDTDVTGGTIVSVDNKKMIKAYVRVVFDDTISTLIKTSDDSEWDGSYRVMSGSVRGESVDVSLLKEVGSHDGDWKVYSVSMVKEPSILAFNRGDVYPHFVLKDTGRRVVDENVAAMVKSMRSESGN